MPMPNLPMPNLLDVQLRSFEKLIEQDVDPKEQWDFGLDRVFAEIFPISDVNENFTLEYVTASLGEPKYSVEECIERDMTYAAPLKAKLRLIVWEELEDKGEKRPGDIIEKEVYLGDLPLLTELGTFIINGAERVVVSQLHRSPGVVFEENIHPNGSKLHSARIIPFRGSWVEFTIDINAICYVHIDKKKKFPATALLRAFGYGTDADIYQLFFTTKKVDPRTIDKQGAKEILGSVIAEEIIDRDNRRGADRRGHRDRRRGIGASRPDGPQADQGLCQRAGYGSRRESHRQEHPPEGSDAERRRGAKRHLLPLAARRRAEHGDRPDRVGARLLQPQAI